MLPDFKGAESDFLDFSGADITFLLISKVLKSMFSDFKTAEIDFS